ncbi:MAG: MgtC/SapB family protein [Candidatus Liptonbacteria bacterium]|nr:MgtC/SapB family protein [Candidatus Liptonbacteria bacterium]
MYTLPTEIALQLGLAVFLGAAIGLERELSRKTAGLRTYALVSLGSAIFTIISAHLMDGNSITGVINYDPGRIAAQIITGIGFIGAGMIIFNQSKLQGITTAAGIWVTAAIGMAVGYRFYAMAVLATILVLFIFVLLWLLEEWIVKKFASEAPMSD